MAVVTAFLAATAGSPVRLDKGQRDMSRKRLPAMTTSCSQKLLEGEAAGRHDGECPNRTSKEKGRVQEPCETAKLQYT